MYIFTIWSVLMCFVVRREHSMDRILKVVCSVCILLTLCANREPKENSVLEPMAIVSLKVRIISESAKK